LSKECSLLIASDAGDRNTVKTWDGAHLSINLTGGMDCRQHRGGDSKEVEKFVIPAAGMKIEQHGAGGVAGFGDVHSRASQLPEQPGIDGTECKAAVVGELAGVRQMFGIQEILLPEK
jgi:hypothetical protein